MTIRTALLQGVKLLEDGGVAPARLTAEVLLAHALRQSRVYLIAHSKDELSELGWIHYGRYLHERLQGKPLQYIVKRQEFYGRDFYVAPGVLIPRPETELLVERVLETVRPGMRVLDIGAGSGCIAATLALECPGLSVLSSDVSDAALAIARRNCTTLAAPVCLVRMDLANGFVSGSFDAVVSNPPYVESGSALAREVVDWEPGSALFAGADGLDVYRRLIPEAWRLLRPGGLLAMEIGAGQGAAVRGLMEGWRNVDVSQDLAGLDRMVTARRG